MNNYHCFFVRHLLSGLSELIVHPAPADSAPSSPGRGLKVLDACVVQADSTMAAETAAWASLLA